MSALVFDEVAGVFDWIHELRFSHAAPALSSAADVLPMGHVDDYMSEARFF